MIDQTLLNLPDAALSALAKAMAQAWRDARLEGQDG